MLYGAFLETKVGGGGWVRVVVVACLQPGSCRVVDSGYGALAGSTLFAKTWARAGGAKLDAMADTPGYSSTNATQVYAQIVDKTAENPARYLEAVMGD